MRHLSVMLVGLTLLFTHPVTARESQSSRFASTIYIAEWSKLRHMAEQGDINSQFQLANYYFQPPKGTTLPQSYAKAARFYRLAALQNHGPSQHNLAVLLLKGQGVDKDRIEARAWFSLAASQGFVAAKQALATLDKTMDEADKAKAQQLEQELKNRIR
ncbi:MAG: sel1 repeat family protein [Gammaproteobacteria bacterium]|nr:sel1 repeat family protein [Gammaproteobacteria bacterium]